MTYGMLCIKIGEKSVRGSFLKMFQAYQPQKLKKKLSVCNLYTVYREIVMYHFIYGLCERGGGAYICYGSENKPHD